MINLAAKAATPHLTEAGLLIAARPSRDFRSRQDGSPGTLTPDFTAADLNPLI
jgi:hypothetical protein